MEHDSPYSAYILAFLILVIIRTFMGAIILSQYVFFLFEVGPTPERRGVGSFDASATNGRYIM